ncbi:MULTISPECIES: UDP-N-acetylglucosamine--N-acetylmuramyl-(pentapeptide) pyrophosphoryl-undecaprenol N-acetylglucosamine transferase [Helicobacter]|uniref:UDP-N-acetylglucosamine--N-acetylmuramyl- (pentapeptide) pyrophosphoryl-undecaprenol N-acetylglucosamine transferase n=1 Tax=Helicobacter TaxID=209 RepID=UPI000EAF3B8F|nr:MULTISPECIES: UDP-N-acetylglucosamine--N-acetylmuramyl-(pentapeptide) pyrophosphoryl-undecaprenol N-acetylglucosamine transferase [Helicobacter]
MFAISGGGTGGHLCVAKALAQELLNRGESLIYVGSTAGQDRAWFETSPLFVERYFLETSGVVNKSFMRKIPALWAQLKGAKKAMGLLKTHRVRALISVGGFSAGPGSLASILSHTPLFIHEQNAIQGALNKYTTPYAKRVFGSFTPPKPNPKFSQTPYPVQEIFFEKARIRHKIETILFLGGSQGASALNDFALLCVRDLLQRGLRVIHQCGAHHFDRIATLYKGLGILESVDLFAFETNLVEKMHQADICVSRAGASSVWELCANNLPTLFVPYPHAATNHQYFNALEFEQAGLARIVPQRALRPPQLFDFIEWLQTPQTQGPLISQVSWGLRNKISSNGARVIVDQILADLSPQA